MSFIIRCAQVAVAGVGACGLLLGGASTAAADEPAPPNCAASDLAGVLSGVAAATSVYMFTHPEVNAFFTDLRRRPTDQQRDSLRAYLDANPQVEAELRGIRAPSVDFRNRCEAPA